MANETEMTAEKKKFFLVRWLYKAKEWTESFADKPHAFFALFLIAFAESSFFPIPPDVLLIAIAVTVPKKSFKAAAWCSIGSVLGGILGYYIGYYLLETVGYTIIDVLGIQDKWASAVTTFQGDVGMWTLLGAAFSPIPYKLATIAAGATHMDLTYFIIISSLGRAARFFIVGSLFYFMGAKAKEYIDKYFERFTILFVILLIGGFIGFKYLLSAVL